MARRSKIGDALAGFSEAYDAVGKIGQDVELAKLGREGATDSVDPETGVKTTTFLGKQYEGGLSQEQMDAARTQRMSDIVGKYNPMQGLEMRRGLKRDAREDKKFDQDMKLGEANLKQMGQNSQLTGLKLNEAKDNDELRTKRRDFHKELNAMTNEALAAHIGDKFNSDGTVPAMLDYDKKTNRFIFVSKVPGMPSQSLSRAELMREATSIWEQGNGDFHTGLNMQLEALKDRHSREREQVGDARDAAHGNAQLAYQDKMYGLHAAGLQLQRERLNDERARMFGTQDGYTVGDDGQMSPAIMGLRLNGRTGNVEPVAVNMGKQMPNFIPGHAFGNVGKTAAGLVGQETGQLTDKGGKVLYTPETADAFARQQVIRAYTGRGSQNGGLDPAILAKTAGLLPGGSPAPQQAPAPSAAQAAPALQQGLSASNPKFGRLGGGQGLYFAPPQAPAPAQDAVLIGGRPAYIPRGQPAVDPRTQPMSYEEALQYLR